MRSNADSPSSVQGSVSSGQKKRKRKANKETQSQLAVRSSAVPINTYEKFLNLFMVKMNSNIAESLNELRCHFTDNCKLIFRHYNRNDYSKPAPANPIGAPNYIEMTGAGDYFDAVPRYLEAMPDYTIIFSDMTIQKLQTKTILAAKCYQESTLISRIPVPKNAQLDHVIDALASKATEKGKDVQVASDDMETIRELVSQMDIIQKDKSSKSTVYLPQAPEILATSSTSSVSPQPSSTNSSFSGVQVDNQAAAAEEEVEYKLVIVPVRMKGWFVVHFLDHDVNKISKIEAHYYASLENT